MTQPVTLVFIRHSKSCANHVRNIIGAEDPISQSLCDPGLSMVGARMARSYRSELRKKLEAAGVDIASAHIGSSPLRRAKQTVALLFGDKRGQLFHVFPSFGEKGNIPENTPTGLPYQAPDWRAFLRSLQPGTNIIVGHGSFLKTTVWPTLSGRKYRGSVHNLDAFVVRGTINGSGHLSVAAIKRISYTGSVDPVSDADHCMRPPIIPALSKKMTRYAKRTRRRTKNRTKTNRMQYGGGPFPLSYFRDGAQMQATYPEPTGIGLDTVTGGSWAREPLNQRGGWAPVSVMGGLLSNGMRFVAPAAGYAGYKLLTRKRKRNASAI